ncbi:MAG: PINc/VapC family ATPase [Candidatus Aenigmatarchaeota archaeon]
MKVKNKWVPDTSVLVGRILSKLVQNGSVEGEIIIPAMVVDELQAQASKSKETGFEGLEEIKAVRDLAKKHNIELKFIGRRPTMEEIMLAKKGRIDALIRDVAKENKAVLITADYVQALVAEAEGISVQHIRKETVKRPAKLEKYFDKETLSVHLKANVIPVAKRGNPGNIRLVKLGEPLSEDEIEDIIKEIMEMARTSENSFFEIGSHGAMVIQLENYRIAIARPPFSDGLEVTAVRPIAKLTLNDYKLSEKLRKRLEDRAEGILICGPPGSGKSTFAASLAEFYLSLEKIVKTMESPRDLQVPDEVTQYGPLNGSFEKTADILLLVRPDYTIFDEVRKTKDFEVFSDMRLAGIGMVGVVHAAKAIDAVQRFMGRVELGMITSVLDTIIFIKDGKVENVFDLSLTVRVPTGMHEADLARPLIEVKDFETGECKYEIYTYGEENVVVPVTKRDEEPITKLAKERVLQEIREYDRNAKVEISGNKAVVIVDNDAIARLIGKAGKNISELEQRLGISIDVEPAVKSFGQAVSHSVNESGAYLILEFDKKLSGKLVSVWAGDEFLFSATIGASGGIKVSKKSEIGTKLLRAVVKKHAIRSYMQI